MEKKVLGKSNSPEPSKKTGRTTQAKVVEEPLATYYHLPSTNIKSYLAPYPKNAKYLDQDDAGVYDMINMVRKGITQKDFLEVQKSTPFNACEWANLLQISERTLQRYRDENKVFQPAQSERIIEIALLYQFGIAVFEDKDNFEAWLNSKIPALGNQRPKDLLDTKFGIELIKDELTRIEHGIFA